MLRQLIISRVRVKVLELFFIDPKKIYYVREIVRRTGEEINAVRRELAHLEKAGLLAKEQRANRLFYCLRRDYPLYFDLMELVAKTTGLGREIIRKKVKLGKIKFAVFTGRFIRGETRGPNEVDVLLVGNTVLPEVSTLIKAEETRRGREINYTVMTNEEFQFRKRRNDPFVKGILWNSLVMIIGDEEELIA